MAVVSQKLAFKIYHTTHTVRCGDVHGPALEMQRLAAVPREVLFPGLFYPQPHAGPEVHDADGEGVKTLFAPPEGREQN